MKKVNRRSKQVNDASSCDDNKQDCAKRVGELEEENLAFKKEIEELRNKLANVSSTSPRSIQKPKENYLQKLHVVEDQVTALKKKLNAQSQLSIQRPRGDEATKRLQFEIQSLKVQKVQLICKMKVESLQFRICKASLEKEVLQLKKEGRRSQHEMHKILDSNQRLKMVLQRKTEEAFVATKRLRELLEFRRSSSGNTVGTKERINPKVQALEYELEITSQLHKLCSDYEHQMEEMAEEIAKLKEEVEVLKQEKSGCGSCEKEVDCLEKDSDIEELKEQVASLSCLVRQLRTQKSELDHENKVQDISSQDSFITSSNQLVESNDRSESDNSQSHVTSNKTVSGVCCTCSKKSLCKTTKCKCRHMGGSCGPSCGCLPSKCANREVVHIQLNDSPRSDLNSSSQPQISEGKTNSSEISVTQNSSINALAEEPADKNDDAGHSKKPLSNIGNILANSNGMVRPGRRKKGRKPVIQLVTVDPLQPSQ